MLPDSRFFRGVREAEAPGVRASRTRPHRIATPRVGLRPRYPAGMADNTRPPPTPRRAMHAKLIAALLLNPNVGATAAAMGVDRATIFRRMKHPAFARAYRKACKAVVAKAVAQAVLTASTGPAFALEDVVAWLKRQEILGATRDDRDSAAGVLLALEQAGQLPPESPGCSTGA